MDPADYFPAGMFNAVGLIAIRVSLRGDMEGLFARSRCVRLPIAGGVEGSVSRFPPSATPYSSLSHNIYDNQS